MIPSGDHRDRNSQPERSRSAEPSISFAALVTAIQTAKKNQSLLNPAMVDELLRQVTDDIRCIVEVSERKLLQLQPLAWREFHREVSPYYLALLTPPTSEHVGFKRFESSLKKAYPLVNKHLIEGRHHGICDNILATLMSMECRQVALTRFPGLPEVAREIAQRSDVDPYLARDFLNIADRALQGGSFHLDTELSNPSKMMATGYLCMPSVRSAFSEDLVQSVLVDLRPSLPPFPGQGRCAALNPLVPPLPSAESFVPDRDMRTDGPESPRIEISRPSAEERGWSYNHPLPGDPSQSARKSDAHHLARYISSIMEHLPEYEAATLYPLLNEPAFRVACLLNAACFDWIVGHARAFCAAVTAMREDWGLEIDSELAGILTCERVTLSSSITRLAAECSRNMLEELRYEISTFLTPKLQSSSPELAQLRPMVRAQLLWSFPPGNEAEATIDRALILEEPNLLRLLCPYVPSGRATRAILERDLPTVAINDGQSRIEPNKTTDRLLRFLLRNTQNITAPLCLSPVEWYPVEMFRESYGAWLREQEVEGRHNRGAGHYLNGCGDFALIARATSLTEEHRRAFATTLYTDYVTSKVQDAPDLLLRTPGLVARALFPVETLRETAALWGNAPLSSAPIELSSIPSPEVPRDPRIALRVSPSGRTPETLLLRPLLAETFFRALGYSDEEMSSFHRSDFTAFQVLDLMSALPSWKCFQSTEARRPSFETLKQLIHAQENRIPQALEMAEAMFPYASDTTTSLSEALGELQVIQRGLLNGGIPHDIGVNMEIMREVAVGIHVLPRQVGSVPDSNEAAPFDAYMRVVFQKLCDESLGADAFSPVDMVFIAHALGVDRYTTARPIAVTVTQSLNDLKLGKTERTPSVWRPHTITLRTHPYINPYFYHLDGQVIKQAVAEHDEVRRKLLVEKSEEVTAVGDWDLIRSTHSFFTVGEDDWSELANIAPLELFFRAIGMGPYEQRELDKLRLPGCAPYDPLEDARSYVEQLAYSVDSVNGYFGGKIRFPSSVRERIRAALRLDDMVQEIRRIYMEGGRRTEAITSPSGNFNFFPKRNGEIRKYFDGLQGGDATVTFLPTRGVIMELLGTISGSCVRRLTNIARTYNEATAIAFISGDQFPLVMGGCLVFKGSLKGSPVLVIRGFNPVYELLDRVDTPELFEKFADYALTLAMAEGCSAVVIAHADFWHNAASIRVPVFFHLQDRYGDEPVEELDDSQVVEFNGLSSRNVVVVRRGILAGGTS